MQVAAYRKGQGRVITEKKVACDFIAMSGGCNPALHLWCHNGGKISFDEALQSFRPDRHHDRITAVGAANGTFDAGRILPKPMLPASAAAKALCQAAKARTCQADAGTSAGAIEPIWFAPATGKYNEGNKHFIDFQNDVTVADLELAQREGYEIGRAHQALHHLRHGDRPGQDVEPQRSRRTVGSDRQEPFRKSASPLSARPIRPSPSARSPARSTKSRCSCRCAARRSIEWHVDHGATFEPVGQWRRAYTYPRAGEDKHAAIDREILGVRNKVGLLDASTLGKIEIKGPDAAEFLDRIYTNIFSTLKVGRCRYGLMMNELGFLTDDGVTVRLGDDHFLMHTTSGGADRIAAWLEEWLQTEWTHYKVFVTPVTEQWAQFAIAGPRARDVLAKLGARFRSSRMKLSRIMSFKEGQLGGYPVRVYPHQLLGRAVL